MLPFPMPTTGSYLFLSLCRLSSIFPSFSIHLSWQSANEFGQVPTDEQAPINLLSMPIQGTPRQTKQFLCVRNCWLCNPNCGSKLSSCRIRVGEEGGNLFFWTTNLYLLFHGKSERICTYLYLLQRFPHLTLWQKGVSHDVKYAQLKYVQRILPSSLSSPRRPLPLVFTEENTFEMLRILCHSCWCVSKKAMYECMIQSDWSWSFLLMCSPYRVNECLWNSMKPVLACFGTVSDWSIDTQIAKSPPTSLRHKCQHWTHASRWRHMLDIRPGDRIRIDWFVAFLHDSRWPVQIWFRKGQGTTSRQWGTSQLKKWCLQSYLTTYTPCVCSHWALQSASHQSRGLLRVVTHVSAISLGGSGLNLAAFPHLSQNLLSSWAWLHLRDLDPFHT